MLLGSALLVSACSLTFPFGGMPSATAPEPVVLTTGTVRPSAARAPDALLADQIGPEDLRRATGAMTVALDPQGNGSPVNWDNAESRASGRFTPVGGPFLRDFEVCRAFLTSLRTQMDQHQFQGTACRPSGGQWSITELKPWKPAG